MIVQMRFGEEQVARLPMKYDLDGSGICPTVSLSSEERVKKKKRHDG